jgi:ubiquinone/menaquinone biosynthesis C-methylase UbiE
MGGNGSAALTQIVPLLRYTNDGDSFLDVGCGSGTTIDALQKIKRDVKYKGVDFIEKHINWLKGEYPDYEFAVEDARHLNEADQSWDIVWSRHVIDHLGDFEQAIDEQCRVAKRRVICVLWCDLSDQDEDTLRPIVAGPEDARITYQDEWTNIYSRKKVMKHLENKKGWTIRDFREDCSWDLSRRDKGHDTLLVLDRI